MDKKVTINGKDYSAGKVEIYDKDKAKENEKFDSPEVYNDPTWFDNSTGNFHIVPAKEVFVNATMDCIKLVGIARADIIAKLKNMLGKESNIKLNASVGWGARDEYRNIEKCVQLEKNSEKNSYKYQLNFERMYVHNNDVNCMFGLFQFYKHPFDDKGINKNSQSFSMAYPDTYEDNGKKTIGDSDERIVYNPELPSLFELWKGNNLEKVCSAFINFVFDN